MRCRLFFDNGHSMNFFASAKGYLDPERLSHRPPLSSRFWIYAAAAYVIPVVVQVGFPEDPTFTDELVWLVTLAPAFLLALHYGLKGAFVALIMGTALFLVVQLVVATNFTPDNWKVTVPTYVAYGVLSISVGWLSEQLHIHYRTAIGNERMAAIGQLALTIKHEVNNALTTIMAETDNLLDRELAEDREVQESLKSLKESARRIAAHVDQITRLETAPVSRAVGQLEMLDLDNATYRGG